MVSLDGTLTSLTETTSVVSEGAVMASTQPMAVPKWKQLAKKATQLGAKGMHLRISSKVRYGCHSACRRDAASGARLGEVQRRGEEGRRPSLKSKAMTIGKLNWTMVTRTQKHRKKWAHTTRLSRLLTG